MPFAHAAAVEIDRERPMISAPRNGLRGGGDGVSIVVPARNAAATLSEQLSALLAQADPRCHEIIIADNGSSDDTAAIAERLSACHSNVRLIDASGRRGSNHARNSGVAAARYEKVLFCDGDDIVAAQWIERMGRALDDFEGVGGKIDLDALNGETERHWRGNIPDLTSEPVDGFLTRPMGANCGVRRSIWEHVGGFDEDFACGGEETEFFWRLQLAGFRWAYVDDAVVHYRLRPERWSLARQFYCYGRARPQLYREFRRHGMPPASSRMVLGAWWHVGRSAIAMLVGNDDGGVFMRDFAYAFGKVVGSVRYRSLYL